eukprot:TRINITY_DN112468_c0_g1_i1.p1 TRINITY_DN112468_c0_g1~~TRINITY_DN112468_c0_g1_i1.p1  ORF type:complete len:296 (+),score=50.42 TRINITY_DN112468_c0_g1_i1:111-890(+)
MVLLARLPQALLLRKVVEAMKDLCKEVNIECNGEGLQLQSLDSSHVALVSLFLRKSAFSDFKCDQPTSLGLNMDAFARVLRVCGPNDSLRLTWEADSGVLNIVSESADDDRIAAFDLKLMEITSEHMEIPEQEYHVVATIPSAEFQKLCRDFKEFGEVVQIHASKQGMRFSTTGDTASVNVVLKPRASGKPEENVSLTVKEPVMSVFALRYLATFAKAAPLCSSVEICLGLDAPLVVKYYLDKPENGYLQFFLAPKIEE